MAQLGFIGLGLIGSRMVKRLLERGHTVVGYNRTRAKAEPLLAMGMIWANSPRAVSEASEMVLTMVADSEAIRAVADGPQGLIAGLGAGKVLVEMSTVSPLVSKSITAAVREKGADMVDAPISGSPITVEQGKVSFMVGGRSETFER